MNLLKKLKRKYKLWRILNRTQSKVIRKQIRRAKWLKLLSGQKHYVLYDYKDRIVVVNTLMLEQFKKKRLLKRNWDKHIIFETC